MGVTYEDNAYVVRIQLKKYCATYLEPILIKSLRGIVDRINDYVSSSFSSTSIQFPVYTANLNDSVGAVVFNNSRIVKVLPPARATKPQSMGSIKGIWGRRYLEALIANTANTYTKGIWMVVYAAVPYAEKINTLGGSEVQTGEDSYENTGVNFFEEIKVFTAMEVEAMLSAMHHPAF